MDALKLPNREENYQPNRLTHGQEEEERQPAEDKHPHNDGERFGRFFLPGELHQPHRQRTSERVVLAGLGAGRTRVLQRAAAVDAQHHLDGLVPLPLDARLQALGGPAGDHVHPEVHDEDDQQRQVEGEERGEERVPGLLRDHADAVVHRRRLLPAQERPHGDDAGGHPQQDEDGHSLPLGHDARVLEAVFHPDVPVYGDDAQAEDGRGAAEHVHRCPDVAEHPAEHPAAQNLERRGEGQHDDAEQQVRHGQVHDEEVGDGLQVFIAQHREDDQNVPNDCHQNKSGEEDPHPDSPGVQGEVPARRDAVVWKHKDRSIGGFREIDPIVALVPRVRVWHVETP